MASKYACKLCTNTYSTKHSLDKHRIICEFRYRSDKTKQKEFEELGDMPTNEELIKVVQEMAVKMEKMECKMEKMQQIINCKKRKINVIKRLSNTTPAYSFETLIKSYLTITPEHFQKLMDEQNMLASIEGILNSHFTQNCNDIYPIKAFIQKDNILFIYSKNKDTEETCWRQAETYDIITLIKYIQFRLTYELMEWKKNNAELIENNNRTSEIFNKTIIKLMSVTDNNAFKIKHYLYNQIKTNIELDCDFD